MLANDTPVVVPWKGSLEGMFFKLLIPLNRLTAILGEVESCGFTMRGQRGNAEKGPFKQ